jgi:tetratricopeptide (TPR) repeat protein
MRRWFAFAWVLAALVTADASAGQKEGAEARRRFSHGMEALRDSRVEIARSEFARAARLAPEWGLAFLQWGVVEQSIDAQSSVARECLERAVALAPDNPRAHYHLGTLYERLGRNQEAAQEFGAALELRPRMRDAQFRLAASLHALGDIEGAISAYHKVLMRERHHTGALTALADLYEHTNELAAAERALVSIVQAQPGVAYHHYRLAQFYERIGERRKARRAYTRADELDPRPQRKMRRLR